jgi:hypothetical protein
MPKRRSSQNSYSATIVPTLTTIITLVASVMVVPITRIAQALMSVSRREILGSRDRSKSQPLATNPRHGCGQRVYDCGQKPPVAPSRYAKAPPRRGSLLQRTSENLASTHFGE